MDKKGSVAGSIRHNVFGLFIDVRREKEDIG